MKEQPKFIGSKRDAIEAVRFLTQESRDRFRRGQVDETIAINKRAVGITRDIFVGRRP